MMIQLSGLAAVGEDGREGDIEIVEIGLRPGEKVHEELLIDNEGLPTSHPRIVKASESGAAPTSFDQSFEELLRSMEERDVEAALAIVEQLISLKGAAKTKAKAPRLGQSRRESLATQGTIRRSRRVTAKPAFGS
jgi:FlaA1/EpsC-like NDP-sugar epimerase